MCVFFNLPQAREILQAGIEYSFTCSLHYLNSRPTWESEYKMKELFDRYGRPRMLVIAYLQWMNCALLHASKNKTKLFKIYSKYLLGHLRLLFSFWQPCFSDGTERHRSNFSYRFLLEVLDLKNNGKIKILMGWFVTWDWREFQVSMNILWIRGLRFSSIFVTRHTYITL